jgi:hypothetical protein
MVTYDDPDRAGLGAADDQDDQADVLRLAGQRLPAEGAWLLITGAREEPGGEFDAAILKRSSPAGYGGDVLVRLEHDDPPAGLPTPSLCASVFAVADEKLTLVASWPGMELEAWPERIRPAVAFAMNTLAQLEEHGAKLGGFAEPAPWRAVAQAF